MDERENKISLVMQNLLGKEIKVEKVEFDKNSRLYDVLVSVPTYLTDDDFDFDYFEEDEDSPAHTEVSFTGKKAIYQAGEELYKYLLNSGKITFDKDDYDSLKKSRYQYWNINGTYHYLRVYYNSDNYVYIGSCISRVYTPSYFEVDEELFEKRYLEDKKNEPKIQIHYTPMVVRGIMDADPEEYDYEVTPEEIMIPVHISVDFDRRYY